jgi:hypothetical protein
MDSTSEEHQIDGTSSRDGETSSDYKKIELDMKALLQIETKKRNDDDIPKMLKEVLEGKGAEAIVNLILKAKMKFDISIYQKDQSRFWLVPKFRAGSFYRVIVNFIFWGSLLWLLYQISGIKVGWFTGQTHDVISPEKILELAEEGMWCMQILAGILALGIFVFVKRFSPAQYPFFSRLVKDDFFAIFLNFGTLFVICFFYQSMKHIFQPFKLISGILSLLIYVFYSPFDVKDFEKYDSEIEKYRVEESNFVKSVLSGHISPKDFSKKNLFR